MPDDDPTKGGPGERGENAHGTTGGAGGAGGVGGEGDETGGSGGEGGTGGAAASGQRLPVEIVGLKDRGMAFGWKLLIFAVLYVGVIFTVAVVATALTPGPPF